MVDTLIIIHVCEYYYNTKTGQVLPDPPLSQETADTPLPSATSDTPPVMESAHPPLPPPQEQECSATSSMADQEAKASADGETIPPEMVTLTKCVHCCFNTGCSMLPSMCRILKFLVMILAM